MRQGREHGAVEPVGPVEIGILAAASGHRALGDVADMIEFGRRQERGQPGEAVRVDGRGKALHLIVRQAALPGRLRR